MSTASYTQPSSNVKHVFDGRSTAWPWARRKTQVWGGNPNHGSGSHSRRRTRLEHRYGQATTYREHYSIAVERLIAKGLLPEAERQTVHNLRAMTPTAIGAMVVDSARTQAQTKKTPYYLPARVMALASALVSLVRRARQLIAAVQRTGWRSQTRAFAHRTRAFLSSLWIPSQIPPPPYPNEPQKETISLLPQPASGVFGAAWARLDRLRPFKTAEEGTV